MLFVACGENSGGDHNALWLKLTISGREHLVDAEKRGVNQLTRAERRLTEAKSVLPGPEFEDARYTINVLFLGLIQRVRGREAEADSMITRATELAGVSLADQKAWRLLPARLIRMIHPLKRRDVEDALLVAREWYPIWQAILKPEHSDVAVMTGLIAAMERVNWASEVEVSDSLFAECLPVLEEARPLYQECAVILHNLQRGIRSST